MAKKKSQQAESSAPAPAASTEKKYNNIALNVSQARVGTKAKLQTLADKLNCRMSDLIWSAIEMVLANPPKVAPVAASPRTGSAPGIWVVHEMGPKGLEGVRLVEVDSRADMSGHVFFRYDADDKKSIDRAIRQAQKTATYDANLAGLDVPDGGFEVEKA